MSLQELSARHEAMMLRIVDGVRPIDVCEEFQITPSRLSVIRGTEIWKKREQELIRERQDASLRRIESLQGLAINALEDTVTDRLDPKLRLASAKEILSRSGLGSHVTVDQGGFAQQIVLFVPPGWNNKEQVDMGDVVEVKGEEAPREAPREARSGATLRNPVSPHGPASILDVLRERSGDGA